MAWLRSNVCHSCLLRLSLIAKRRASTAARAAPSTPPSPQILRRTPKKSNQRLPDYPARTRFAPSPTGYLHLGSLRTALFNYLLARSTGGQFLLRIEDTDRSRTIADAEERLCDDLEWAGLSWDEGPDRGGPYGPYRQSERTAVYQKHAQDLVETGHAYRCFCSTQRLRELADFQNSTGLPVSYDRKCADIPKDQSDERAANGESHVVRLRMPDSHRPFHDLVYGQVGGAKGVPGRERQDGAFDDSILLKSDQQPTYHLANVVDDHLMKITHVVRGSEWLTSTPKHVAMYDAFGWEPPQFAHVGLLVNESQAKLSKRDFDVDIASYRDKQGVLPEALSNFVALLGWSHLSRSDCKSMEELIEQFSLKFTKGNTVVTPEKLWFLQKQHAQRRIQSGKDLEPLVQKVTDALEAKGLIPSPEMDQVLRGRSLPDYIGQVLKVDSKNYHSAEDLVERCKYLFGPVASALSSCSESDINKFLQSQLYEHLQNETHANEALETLFDPDVAELSVQTEQLASISLSNLTDWSEESIKSSMQEMQRKAFEGRQRRGWQDPDLKRQTGAQWYHFLRTHLANGEAGPAIAAVMATLGREESIWRLENGIVAELVASDLSQSLKELDPRILSLWAWIGRPLPRRNPLQ